MLARPTFHEVYGLSLTVSAIDPSYTLGEMAMKRRETLERLTKEGVIDQNRRLALPPVLQRIAVISSSTAAGYGDFRSRLITSPYSFSVMLFEAYMQGERAERSILSALESLKKDAANFDALVVIRGGGAQADLQCFDGYALAREIALFPLPVLSGIGHERDETVVDRVAHMRLITPTATAEFVISKARDFEARVDALSSGLARFAERLLRDERRSLEAHGRLLGSAVRNYMASRGHELSAIARRFEHSAVRDLTGRAGAVEELAMLIRLHGLTYLKRRGVELEGLEARARLLDPVNVLKRGYSITTLGGRAVADASALRKGDIINTRLYRGEVTSIVEKAVEEREDVG
jgi:exodeoxyribonuclease VII large subunit